MKEMKAIILAAGRGKRLIPLTDNMPKCLLKVGNRRIIEYQLESLSRVGIKDIVIVTGHLAENIKEFCGNSFKYVHNYNYLKTDNLFSLWIARNELKKEFIYLYSDMLFEPKILKKLVSFRGDFVFVVEEKTCCGEEMRVRERNGCIVELSKEIPTEDSFGEFIGIAKFSEKGRRILMAEIERIIRSGDIKADIAVAITNLAEKGNSIKICMTDDLPWIEIDTEERLREAEEEILSRIEEYLSDGYL